MSGFSYQMDRAAAKTLGLIVLQADERIESDFRRLVPAEVKLYGARIPSSPEVTSETLARMEAHLAATAALLPGSPPLHAVGYGCTSGSAQIGPARVAKLVREGVAARAVSDPVSALVAACRALGLSRLALLSPYVESVSDRLRQVLAAEGIETPVFGSFDEPEEAKVARISEASVARAARALAQRGDCDGLFLSCTNLQSLGVIAPLEEALGLPVLSSNLVLAWHMLTLAAAPPSPGAPGRLFHQANGQTG